MQLSYYLIRFFAGDFWKDREEDAIGTVEVILIMVVLIALVILFKGTITDVVNQILDKIKSQAGSV